MGTDLREYFVIKVRTSMTKRIPKDLKQYWFVIWRLVEQNSTRIVFRPSTGTLWVRFWVSFMAALPAFGIVWLLTVPQGEVSETVAAMREKQYVGLLAVLMVLAPIVVLPMLSCLWNHITLRDNGRGLIEIRSWKLVPRRKSFRVDALDHIQYAVEEVVVGNIPIHATSRQRVVGRAWVSSVLLMPKPGTQGSDTEAMLFRLGSQPDRPRENTQPPAQVLSLLTWLQQRTGARISGPLILDARAAPEYYKTLRMRFVEEAKE